MENPLVSIIIPNFNYARYLDLRIESILNQTYKNYEIIILDDKSTDDSVDVIKNYIDHPKVSKVIFNEVNSGSPFIQWQKGISESSGEIVWIAESDDTCSPFFLEKLVKSFNRSNVAFAFCRSILIDEYGKEIRENNQIPGVRGTFEMNGEMFIRQYLCYGNVIQNASSVLFSKVAALNLDDEYIYYRGSGDWLFWIKMCLQGNVFFLDEKLNNYRLHNNTTSSLIKSGIEFKEMKRIYEWLLNRKLIDSQIFSKCRYNNILFVLYADVIPVRVKEEIYSMWNVAKWERCWIRVKNNCRRVLFFIKKLCK